MHKQPQIHVRSRKCSDCVADWTLILAAILTILLIGGGTGLAVHYWHPIINDIKNVQTDINVVQDNIDEIKRDLAKLPNITVDVINLELKAESLLGQAQTELYMSNKTLTKMQQVIDELTATLCRDGVLSKSCGPQ